MSFSTRRLRRNTSYNVRYVGIIIIYYVCRVLETRVNHLHGNAIPRGIRYNPRSACRYGSGSYRMRSFCSFSIQIIRIRIKIILLLYIYNPHIISAATVVM